MGAGPRVSKSSRISMCRLWVLSCEGMSRWSPGAMMEAGFRDLFWRLILPAVQAFAARERVLKRRVAHSHLSIRMMLGNL